MSFSATVLTDVLRKLPLGSAPRKLCVALSGGLDSTVLLHSLASLRGRDVFDELRAVHIDHALHPDSGSWSDACAALAAGLGVALTSTRVDVSQMPGDSPEDAARRARYKALRGEIRAGERLCVAHHADDQLETVLLQLLRGAGPAGLAAMPAVAQFGRGWLLRPLLETDRSALAAYAVAHDLGWLEDPSNLELGPARNYLRHVIVPRLKDRWPGVTAAAGRSAALCAEAQDLLSEMGMEDLAALGVDRTLDVAGLCALGEARQRNLLRVWLKHLGLSVPDRRRTNSIVTSVVDARDDARPEVRWSGGAVRKYRGRLHALDQAQLAALDRQPAELAWHPPRALPLGPGLGRLEIEIVSGEGLDPERLVRLPLSVRYRRGGEKLKPPGSDHRRSLKKLLQEAGIPPWWRGHLPLVFAQDRLVAVADLWIDTAFAAAPGQSGWRIRWRDHPRLA